MSDSTIWSSSAGPADGVPGSAEVLSQGGSDDPPEVGRRRWWPVALGAAAVLAVSGAGVALGMYVGGGGTQPEELMPADTLAFADVDFDPGADQKVNLLRLLNRFPEVADELGDRDDIREWLLTELLSDSGLDADEIQQWVGDRGGVGVSWPGSGTGPTVMIAIQVTDEDAAAITLRRELTDEQWAFDQGYVLITQDFNGVGGGEGLDAAEVVSAAADASLADNPDFTSAMDPLGSGVASVYIDGARVTEIIEQEFGWFSQIYEQEMLGETLAGTTAAVLKIEPDAIAIDGFTTESIGNVSTTPTELMAGLPNGTMAALAFTGGAETVSKQWQMMLDQLASMPPTGYADVDGRALFERGIAKIERQYNLSIPDDIETIVGTDVVVAVDGDDVLTSPGVGLRSVTDPSAAAELANRVQPVIDELTGGFGITIEGTDEGLVAASSPEYAQTLAEGNGGLLDDERVQQALVDVENASGVGWVDLDKVETIAGIADPEISAALDPLSGVGFTSGGDGDGFFLHVRLTFDE